MEGVAQYCHAVVGAEDHNELMVSSQPLLLTDSEVEGGFSNEDGQQLVQNSEDKENKGIETVGRILPSVGAFTVQCALCLKWRLIPTKEQYEEIRQYVLEDPFVCSRACPWRPNASCDDPSDLSQDRGQLWAIDRPNIPLAPSGWERLLVLRGAGSTRFADVYYKAPSGKRLRSMPEVERFLAEHPEYVSAGVQMSQFSFVIPRPLDQGYVRKKTMDSLSGMRGRIVDKSRASNTQLKHPSFKPSTSKERSEKVFAHKKSLARILAGGQSWGLQGTRGQRHFSVSGDTTLATQAIEEVSVNRSSLQEFQGQRDLPVIGASVVTTRAMEEVSRNGNSPQLCQLFEDPKEHAVRVGECGRFIDNQTGGRSSWHLTDLQPSNIPEISSVPESLGNNCIDLEVSPESSSLTCAFKERASLVLDVVEGIYDALNDHSTQARGATEFRLQPVSDSTY